MNLIGVSKLMCWACYVYVKEINKRREDDCKKPYVLSGTSGKVHHEWLIRCQDCSEGYNWKARQHTWVSEDT
jgi:OTT_1508-like deaminase